MAGDRRVGVAMDFSPCSRAALQWAADNVVREGDHLIIVNVQKEVFYEGGEMQLWEATGSPLIPLSEISDPTTLKKYGVKVDAETLDMLNIVARQKQIVLVMKIYWGDPREKICEAIDNIPLSCLIIGNRGLGKIKRVFMGSVSNFVVNNGSCPITVVKSTENGA
ncbi:Universal stress protein A-like protein [Apostasia shenzhenica]|uniref:Universal stress protein A-like protein n=1 Tax=Apostasia shenzhenica TaxID=1088818 RepID=A0A2I0AHB7_9ASPA|nr:Universal stress protein A-like protein [Apostasia shenzhenica]